MVDNILVCLLVIFSTDLVHGDLVGQHVPAVLQMVKDGISAYKYDWNKVASNQYSIDNSNGYGRIFDGIGGLSGGGATSRLLVNYPQKYRDEILDYLFKPNFGASLHILKVEIGGDCQTTDGTEPSHMHTEDETPNFDRGYEWWLMKEAKKRNPEIKLVGLPWGWPGWIGADTYWPYSNITKPVNYVVTWLKGAASHHNLTIDYVGIWNERPYDSNYIKLLRKTLDQNALSHVAIVAADGSYSSTISEALLHDPELSDAIQVIGSHYPGTVSKSDAEKTGKILWASEDFSTYNDDVGAGCWARLLNQNYVNGNMTATIAWNLVASYYDNLPFERTSLMTANEPWSGHYVVPNVLWVTAHTTQFTKPGWSYLKTVGHLKKGGSYVALSDRKSALTIVIETMTRSRSKCIRPFLPPFFVEKQDATFVLGGTFKNINKMFMRHTYIGASTTPEQVFVQKTIEVTDGQITLTLDPDTVITLSTFSTGTKGSYTTPPASAPFPLPYSDDFNRDDGHTEAADFADQSGVFQLFKNESSVDGHKSTMRQVVTRRPVTWCDDADSPVTVIGNYSWTNINVTVDVKLENAPAIFVAARVTKGGCDVRAAEGVFLWISPGSWVLNTNLARTNHSFRCHSDWKCWLQGSQSGLKDWNTVSLVVANTTVSGFLNSIQLFKRDISTLPDVPSSGWAAFGVQSFSNAQFDNFIVQ